MSETVIEPKEEAFPYWRTLTVFSILLTYLLWRIGLTWRETVVAFAVIWPTAVIFGAASVSNQRRFSARPLEQQAALVLLWFPVFVAVELFEGWRKTSWLVCAFAVGQTAYYWVKWRQSRSQVTGNQKPETRNDVGHDPSSR